MAGGTEFNRGKFKDLVLYMSQQSAQDEGFGMVKLNKLLYRADFESYRELGHSISGEEYEKQEYGPVARHLPIVLDELAASEYVIWQRIARGPYTRKVPTATQNVVPNMAQFSDAERAIIDRSLADLAPHGGKSVSEWSHEQSSGWRAAAIGQHIPYGSAFVSNQRLSDAQMKRALQRSREENWAAIRP